jgi:DNA primase catalytic core
MARIPSEEIQRIKDEVSIRRYLEAKGYEFRKHGADIVCPCPFPDHDDRNPSFVVSEAKNTYHCFGCGKKGTIIDLVMALESVGFRHAVELLREGLPAVAADGKRYTTVRRLASPVEHSADEQAALRSVIDYYHERLGQTPDALDYLQKRGITSEAVKVFRLGFVDRSLGLRLPAGQVKEGKEIRQQLQAVGILRKTGHEHFRGCVTFPIISETGDITEVYGRKVSDANAHKGAPSHVYLPGPHSGIWNPHGLQQGDGEVILCEAIIDALTFWCAGFRNVTAAYGTNGFTADHVAAFQAAGIKCVRIAFDRDEAGDRAAVAVAAELAAVGIMAYRVQFPHGMDANGFAVSTGPADKSLGLVLRSAQWMGTDEQKPTSSLTSQNTEEPAKPELVKATSESEQKPKSPDVFTSTDTGAVIHKDGADIHVVLGDRGYRIRGLAKNTSYDVLNVNIRASCGDHYHIDRFDLFNARARSVFVNQAADELQVKSEAIKKTWASCCWNWNGCRTNKSRQRYSPMGQRWLSCPTMNNKPPCNSGRVQRFSKTSWMILTRWVWSVKRSTNWWAI